MWTYNCAKVLKGSYSVDTNEFCHEVNCNYEVIKGKVSTRKIKPTRVWQPQVDAFSSLQSFNLSPITDMAIIRINSGKRSHLVKLIKPKQGLKRTIFKESL
jgi:hypothetical protein